MHPRPLLLFLFVLLFLAPSAARPAEGIRVRFTPPFPWARDLGAPPRIPLVGDVDGDGYADLLSLWPKGKCWIDVALNGKGQKSLPPRRALSDFGEDCLAATTRNIDDPPGDEVIALFRDGTLRVAGGLGGGTPRVYLAGKVALPGRPARAWLGVGRSAALIDSFGLFPAAFAARHQWSMLAIALADGTLLVGEVGTEQQPVHALRRVKERLWSRQEGVAVREVGIHLDPDTGLLGDWQVHWKDGAGRQFERSYRHQRGQLTKRIGVPESRIRDGRILAWHRPSVLLLGDINGDHLPDFVRFRQDDDPHAGSDVLVYLMYLHGKPDPDSDGLTSEEEKSLGSDPLSRDTDRDGLLDGWEVHGCRGFDLNALGCRPTRADILVRVQRVSDMDDAKMRAEMERARRYYAELPVINPDASLGIALHVEYDPPIGKEKTANRGWWSLGDEFFPAKYRGLWHWMLVYNAGGGQAGMLEDRGSAGGSALYATFIHEFGHQLGLSHEGFWPGGWCPAYPSLMNYAYSYQLGGSKEAIGYSAGRLKRITFDERDLSEKLPLKYEQAAFLAGPPYRWRLKADGNQTLVDWNWNGVFGEEHVRADINYGYSTTAGERQILMPGHPQGGKLEEQDRTGHAPALITHQGKLYLFYVAAPRDAKADEKMTPEERRAAAPIDGPLLCRIYQGAGKWTSPAPVHTTPHQSSGDPAAVSHLGKFWLFYPTKDGVQAQLLAPSGKAAGEPVLLPNSQGDQVSPLSWGERLLLFHWRGPDREVAWSDWDGRRRSQERSLGFKSTIPVGPCVDTVSGELLLGCAQDQDEKRPSRWQVRRFGAQEGKGGILSLVERKTRWVMGEAGQARGTRRPTLLFEAGPQVGPRGRLHFIATGAVTEASRKACYYDCMTVDDKSVNDGWLQKRYYDEWTESSSAVAACWFEGDIALASRWYGVANRSFRDNGLYVAYHGLGIQAEPMGDFDDIAYIRDRGMLHSILYFAP
jgi:hypothetical protein